MAVTSYPLRSPISAERVWTEGRIREIRIRLTVFLFVLQIFDLVLTYMVLNRGGYEANPLSAVLIAMGLVIPLKLFIPIIAIVKAVWFNKPSRFRWNNLSELSALMVAMFVTGVYCLVVVMNSLTLSHYS